MAREQQEGHQEAPFRPDIVHHAKSRIDALSKAVFSSRSGWILHDVIHETRIRVWARLGDGALAGVAISSAVVGLLAN